MRRIYLDHAATTPLLPEARDAMLHWLGHEFGNPSSLHAEGRLAKDAIDEAREAVSGALVCHFGEVIFTGSGTEAANLAILGTAMGNTDPRRRRVLLGAGEHHCVLHTQPLLERLGFQVEWVPISPIGLIQLDALEEMLGDDVLLVSVMHANNELGTIQPVSKIASLAKQHGALFHCDAVQTFLAWDSKYPVQDVGADLLTISAHKIGGPKGIGAIYIRAGLKLAPLIVGGGQEREMRAGTENVAAIAGFGSAVRHYRAGPRTRARNMFVDCLQIEDLVHTVPNRAAVLPGHAHVRIPGIQAETMLILLDRMGISASSGAACSSGSLEPSHVLLACGYTPEEAKEGLRFTFGWNTDLEDAQEAARRVNEAWSQIVAARVN